MSVFQAELSAHASVQSLLATEQTVVTRLRNKNSEQRKNLRQWEEQYSWQIGTQAGANSQPLEEKSAISCRLNFADGDAEDEEEEEDEIIPQHPRAPEAREPPQQAQPETPNRLPQREEGASPGYSTEGNGQHAPRPKEADRIRVTAWPKPATFRQWRMALLDEVAAASAQPQRAFEWMLELLSPGVTFESLRATGDDT